MMVYCFLNGERNPLLGRRRWRGICPPSKPALVPPPDRAFWPFDPRQAVLPWPEPIPLPTRFLFFLAPSGGFNSSSLIRVPFQILPIHLIDGSHDESSLESRVDLAKEGFD